MDETAEQRGKRLDYYRAYWQVNKEDIRRKKLVKQYGITVEQYVYSDAAPAYESLWEFGYHHGAINHSVHYVHGRVHTNTLENFWSLLKRGLHGTYVSVEPCHLHRYVEERLFAYNERKATDSERFQKVLGAVAGKRLTYSQLTTR